jgi:exopolyphosphatase/pppGpp-phosphohydrolase
VVISIAAKYVEDSLSPSHSVLSHWHIMSGQEEAALSFIGTNHLLGLFPPAPSTLFFATIEVGGGSSQATAAVSDSSVAVGLFFLRLR